MMKENLNYLLEIVKKYTKTEIDEKDLKKDFNKDLNIDSLSMMGMIVEIENTFLIDFKIEEMVKLQTIEDVLNYINNGEGK